MKKRGFTLIELLAVIVILAIVALIATPIVLNVVEDVKKSATESSVLLYVDAVKLAYTEEMLKNTGKPLKELADAKMSGGNKVSCEVATYIKNKGVLLSGCTVGDDTTKYYYFNGLSTEKSAELSAYLGETKCVKATNVTSGVLATEENPYVLGGEYNCTLGDGETRTFFVLEETTDTVSLIMDRNLGSNVAWISEEDYDRAHAEANDGFNCSYTNDEGEEVEIPACENYGPITATNYLKSITSSWQNVEVSLPTKEKIESFQYEEQIEHDGNTYTQTKYPEWLKSKIESYADGARDNLAYHVYFTSEWVAQYIGIPVMSTQLESCIYDGFGCIIPDPTTDGLVGVRPVITISKTLMD